MLGIVTALNRLIHENFFITHHALKIQTLRWGERDLVGKVKINSVTETEQTWKELLGPK